ncbi:hypothetical protein CWE06_05960 [Aliidiomarina haloalkalitolerans]|uniref:Uncharacterized protein n=1 Tax=Aliidiomarina haloalkalitolerans TaxID=859059 RepID=A0A432VUW6_9GAMM|nr:hypothetical protein CWE06_05960 [Aliidiomarina haloalkalitolerans]
MASKKHPVKEIDAAVRFAERCGWRLISAGHSAHCLGRLLCPYGSVNALCRCGDFCMISVWSTPRNGQNHANSLRRAVEKCILMESQNEDV